MTTVVLLAPMVLHAASTAGPATADSSDVALTALTVTVSSITDTSTTVSWSTNKPVTGWVDYGTTTDYGETALTGPSDMYLEHSERLSGLDPGTLYHVRVKAMDLAGELTMSDDGTFTTLTGSAGPGPAPSPPPGDAGPTPQPTPTLDPGPVPDPSVVPDPTPSDSPGPTGTPDPVDPAPGPTSLPGPGSPSPGGTATYGAALNVDTKANLQVGWTNRARVAHRFVASTTSALLSVRFQQRGGPIYSGGTGGRSRITVETDADGVPSGTVLATAFYTPPSASGPWAVYDLVTFDSPANLVQGTRYDIVFENVDPDPVRNYFSVNDLYVYGATLTPRQPAFADNDYAVLYAAPTTWTVQDHYTADMDITYANGVHDGVAYVQNMTAYFGVISGRASVREHFTVSGGDRTITQASVRVRRSSGMSPLTISLETGTGALIEAVDAGASAVPVSGAGGDTGGSVWVTVTFATVHVLTDGMTYDLRLSTSSDTAYTAAPIREGTDVGLLSYAFRDGTAQSSSDGTDWADLYKYSPVDLQFYFR